MESSALTVCSVQWMLSDPLPAVTPVQYTIWPAGCECIWLWDTWDVVHLQPVQPLRPVLVTGQPWQRERMNNEWLQSHCHSQWLWVEMCVYLRTAAACEFDSLNLCLERSEEDGVMESLCLTEIFFSGLILSNGRVCQWDLKTFCNCKLRATSERQTRGGKEKKFRQNHYNSWNSNKSRTGTTHQ